MDISSQAGGLYCDRQTAREAVQLALPLLEAALADSGIGQSGVLYVVVMDPTRPPGLGSFEEAILFEQALGKEPSAWDADYAGFARAKARLSWKSRRDSAALQALSPHLLERGDTTLWGSIVLDGIVVAISGLDPIYDETFSGVIAMCLRGLSKVRARDRK